MSMAAITNGCLPLGPQGQEPHLSSIVEAVCSGLHPPLGGPRAAPDARKQLPEARDWPHMVDGGALFPDLSGCHPQNLF